MREVDPFDYWESHSSAIEGLGGRNRSPDPSYCFHTRYHEVRPGHASFIVRLAGVRASFGELSVRIHAWKPETDSNISLVSGSRLLLQAEEDGELSLSVPFAALKGVLYAFYGYMSEDSDVVARALRIEIDEPEEDAEYHPEPSRSILAMDHGAGETRPANALLHFGRTKMDLPVSQNCTHDQIAALPAATRGDDGGMMDRVIDEWSERVCLNALAVYGVTYAGLDGLVVGSASDGCVDELRRRALVVRRTDGAPPPRTSGDFVDFLLMPAGFGEDTDARGRWQAVEGWLERLKIGGLAVLGLRYRPEGDLVSSSAAPAGAVLSRNEIGQWALRLIGAGYSVAPLAFAPISSLVADSRGLVGFVMIVQRL